MDLRSLWPHAFYFCKTLFYLFLAVFVNLAPHVHVGHCDILLTLPALSSHCLLPDQQRVGNVYTSWIAGLLDFVT